MKYFSTYETSKGRWKKICTHNIHKFRYNTFQSHVKKSIERHANNEIYDKDSVRLSRSWCK